MTRLSTALADRYTPEREIGFGDWVSYALSVARGEPLLFVSDGFPKTDVEACPWSPWRRVERRRAR